MQESERSVARSRLSPEKAALLQKLLRGELANVPDKNSIPRRAAPQEPAPLSFAQQRLWFLDQLEPNNPFYNIPAPLRIYGLIDVRALEASLKEIVRRHEVLRTRVIEVNGQPAQVVVPDAVLPFQFVDLTNVPEARREAEARCLITEEVQVPFRLAQCPLLRVMLLRLEEQEHVLLITAHHIVSDDWSMGILFRELTAFYTHFVKGGGAISLAPPAIQYADYALWQRRWLTGPVLDEQVNYWKQMLRGAPPLLALPIDRPRPPVQTYRGAAVSFSFPKLLTEQLNLLARQHDATLFMVLLAAFEILISRYTGETNYCVGTPVANRTKPETEQVIGFFINTLVLRADVSGNPSFVELLRRVHDIALGAQSHQDLPFEKVVEELQPVRDISHSPLFQVMFVLHNVPRGTLEVPGLRFRPVEVEDRTAKFDIVLDLTEREGTLNGFIEYSTDLFEETTIQRMVAHYQMLLESIAACPTARVGELTLLSASEYAERTQWNETRTEYPDEASLADLFEAQVRRSPAAVAVEEGTERLTYAELDARAEAVAAGLVAEGVGPDVIVGVLAERSVELVVLLLGVFKAGGGYLPLDPQHPDARWQQILTQGQVSLVVTTEGLAERANRALAGDSGDLGLRVRSCGALRGAGPRPPRRTHGAQVAYVIFTSGSTGMPKGAVVTQQGMINNVWGKVPTLGLTALDVVAQTASQCFDISVWQLLSALLCGARVEIVGDDIVRDPPRLLAELARTGVTVAELVPSLLREVVAVEPVMALPRLRWLLPTGEAVTPDLCRSWFARYPTVPLLNAYGPAECADDVAYHAVQGPPSADELVVPIGRPAANLQLYVLSPELHPVPLGVAGEIWVGGVGVGRGYLQEPGRTAAAFVPHPFSDEAGARLYRTGDIGRYRSDGTVEFLGRRDHQVKVRGFRIELGEIEAALAAQPGIHDQVVVVREDPPGHRRVVAYVVGEPGLQPETLRTALRERLPDYMVPSTVVSLEALPLTPNGKVDRQALPAPTGGSRDDGRYEAPQTPTEELLAGIWAELLGASSVGRHDNFFDLGGDSILSIQVISRARQRGVMLAPRHVFQHQTVAALARAAESEPHLKIEEGPVQGDVPLTPVQEWFFEEAFPNPHYYNQAVLLELTRVIDPAILRRAIETVIGHHDVFRLRFTQEGQTWRQSHQAEAPEVILHREDLSTLSNTQQDEVLEQKASQWQSCLHLEQGPTVQTVLFDLGTNRSSRLLIIIHHLIVDGVSWRILLEDLMTTCGQLLEGHSAMLPSKTSSFQRWSERLRTYAQSGMSTEEIDYWLDPIRTLINPLPVDDPSGDETAASSEIVTLSLGAEETRLLLHEVPAAYRTQINDVLLAALAYVLGQWSGNSAVLIDLEGHGREDLFQDVDISRTVGWFTSIFPVAVRITEEAQPGDLIKSVKEQLRRIPNKGIGYGLLRYLRSHDALREQLCRFTAPEISFNYLGQFDQTFPAEAPFRLASEAIGKSNDVSTRLPYALDINVSLLEGRLVVAWGYSRHRYKRETIVELGESYLVMLNTYIQHCVAQETGSYTPSDFPDIDIDQGTLDHIFEEIG